MTKLLRQVLVELEQPAPSVPDDIPPEPRDRRPLQRRLKAERNVVTDQRPEYTLEEATMRLEQVATDYLDSGKRHAMIMGAPPGIGKTTMLVRLAERAAERNMRVLYCGPRRDFFADVIDKAQRPEWWYDWIPRQEGDESTGQLRTCLYTKEMTIWLHRGYEAKGFCANNKICGYRYMNEGVDEVRAGYSLNECRGCKYHAQKGVRQQIVFGRHQHLTLGHPLMKEFDLIIGDELPIEAFLNHWHISKNFIAPAGMDITDPFTEIVHIIERLAREDKKVDGPDLLAILGGAKHVQEACEAWQVRVDDDFINPNLKSAGAVESVPYFHLLSLGKLLYRESIAAQEQSSYPHRVVIAKGQLQLLLRRNINDEAIDKPMIWLDATANETLYQAMFAPKPIEVFSPHVRLTGKVYQIWNRSNNKRAFYTEEGGFSIDTKDMRPRIEQMILQVKRIVEKGEYKRPVVITYKEFCHWFEGEGYETAYFYAARGTNRFEGCDVAIIVGTPQPNILDIEATARMLFFDRMEPFNIEWSELDVPYMNQPFSYPVTGFWRDPQLQAMLWQQREAELIQSAHRVRPLRRKVDIWLLTNLPLDGVPPDELLTINNLFDAPGNVDPYQWREIDAYAVEIEAEHGYVTTVDLVQKFDLTRPTASKYIDLLADLHGWPIIKAAGRGQGKGKAPKSAGRQGSET